MQRHEIINYLISKYKLSSYLEIGTQLDNCLSQVKCNYKVGVDPDGTYHDAENSDKFYELASDDYFLKNKLELGDKFDIIFIDGLHENKQVLRDIDNALDILNPDGFILVHDCNPLDHASQTPIYWEDGEMKIPHVATWNGDVWKAWVKLRYSRPDLLMYCIDTDQGCGLIQKGKQETIKLDIHIDTITYSQLEVHRKIWLHLLSVRKFKKIY